MCLALIPQLQASISPAIKLGRARTAPRTVRASVQDIEITLLISVVLVILVVFVFLRTVRATIIPSIAVPLSLIGTFGVMYLLGYTLDNLSLMALAISTGFVVDDAIVVLENITRYLEQGMAPVQAAFRGAREIGFTVLSMSTSLIAVFIPMLMMGGIVGRLFREFAVTLSIAIAVSLVVSLTTTPTMCAQLLKPLKEEKHNMLIPRQQKNFRRSPGDLRSHADMRVAPPVCGVDDHHHGCVPERLPLFKSAQRILPPTGHGRIQGSVQAAQDISFDAMSRQDAPLRQDRDGRPSRSIP